MWLGLGDSLWQCTYWMCYFWHWELVQSFIWLVAKRLPALPKLLYCGFSDIIWEINMWLGDNNSILVYIICVLWHWELLHISFWFGEKDSITCRMCSNLQTLFILNFSTRVCVHSKVLSSTRVYITEVSVYYIFPAYVIIVNTSLFVQKMSLHVQVYVKLLWKFTTHWQ